MCYRNVYNFDWFLSTKMKLKENHFALSEQYVSLDCHKNGGMDLKSESFSLY